MLNSNLQKVMQILLKCGNMSLSEERQRIALNILRVLNLEEPNNIEYQQYKEEVLLDIPEFPGYKASSLGKIYSTKTNRFLKPFISNSGYEIVSLCSNNKSKKYSVHRLIAMTFHKNSNSETMVVNHVDGNKTNNNVNNLRWATFSENNFHSYSTGLNIPKNGEDHFCSRLSNSQVNEIKFLLSSGLSYAKIAQIFNVSETLIGSINRGQRRKNA